MHDFTWLVFYFNRVKRTTLEEGAACMDHSNLKDLQSEKVCNPIEAMGKQYKRKQRSVYNLGGLTDVMRDLNWNPRYTFGFYSIDPLEIKVYYVQKDEKIALRQFIRHRCDRNPNK